MKAWFTPFWKRVLRPAARTPTSVTSVSPIIRADAVLAVRDGFRVALPRASLPAARSGSTTVPIATTPPPIRKPLRLWNYIGYVAAWRGVFRMIRGHGAWDKTARTADVGVPVDVVPPVAAAVAVAVARSPLVRSLRPVTATGSTAPGSAVTRLRAAGPRDR